MKFSTGIHYPQFTVCNLVSVIISSFFATSHEQSPLAHAVVFPIRARNYEVAAQSARLKGLHMSRQQDPCL